MVRELGAPDFREQDIFRQSPNTAFVVGAWSTLPSVDDRVRGSLARTEREGDHDEFALYLADSLGDVTRYYPVLSGVGNFSVPTHEHSTVDRMLIAVVDGGGSPITTGLKADSGRMVTPFEIVGVNLVARPSGDAVLDILKNSFDNFPPTVGDSICGGNKPTLTSDLTYRDTVLSGWDTVLDAGDVLRFTVDSAALITNLTLTLELRGSIT
jgi:hypothetical protein